MAAMMLMLINFNNKAAVIVSINIIAAILGCHLLISQLFLPRLLKVAPLFHSLAVDFTSFLLFNVSLWITLKFDIFSNYTDTTKTDL